MTELLNVDNLSVWFPGRGGVFGRVTEYMRAVRGVSLSLSAGEILAVVGESGCGKSTLASALVGLVPWQAGGRYTVAGQSVAVDSAAAFHKVRDQVQMVFQDPFSSLNPRQTVQEILTYPVLARGLARTAALERMHRALERVGMATVDAGRFPHAFSGGQRQRIGIARALMLEPRILLCDEVTSALDVSVQAQILALIEELRRELGLAVLFISHDLSVVRALADRVQVMYQGEVVEEGLACEMFAAPAHPYTRALLDSVPSLDRTRPPHILAMENGNVKNDSGCRFRHRCAWAQPDCAASVDLICKSGRYVRCLHPLNSGGSHASQT